MSETTCRHEWIEDSALCELPSFMCTECGQTCPACNTCNGPTGSSLLTCQRCLDREKAMLDDIEDALSHWQPPSRSIVPAIRYDRDRRGGNEPDIPVHSDESPADIEAVLWDWVAMWSDLSGSVSQVGAYDYLRGHLIWASHHEELSGWHDYRREMRLLRHRARRLAGLLPQRQDGRCIYCGGDVVRDWADDQWQPRMEGLTDELRCTDCRTEWDDLEHWRFANRHTIRLLPLTHPERLVTREDVRSIWPEVPAATWRKWVERDARRGEALMRYADYCQGGRFGPSPEPERMPTQGFNHRGQPLYRIADLQAHVTSWAADPRVARKVG